MKAGSNTRQGSKSRTTAVRRRTTKPTVRPKSSSSSSAKSQKPTKSAKSLLSPKSIADTMKTVGNLRGMVKNWLNYLQQADQVLDTLFITSSSLKESGVLDKLVKSKGRNLSTEDFTSILVTLMNTPLGGQMLKGLGGGGSDGAEDSTKTPSETE